MEHCDFIITNKINNMMFIKTYLRKQIQHAFNAKDTELRMVNLWSLKTNIPEVNMSVQDSYKRHNIQLFKFAFFPLLLACINNIMRCIFLGDEENRGNLAIASIFNFSIMAVNLISSKTRMECLVLYISMFFAVFHVVFLTIVLGDYIPFTTLDQ